MEKFEWYHFMIFVFIFYMYKRYMRNKNKIDDRLLKELPVVKNLQLHIFLLAILPFVLFSSKLENLPIEKTSALLISIIGFRCLQYYINEKQNLDFLYPTIITMSLMFMKYEIVSRENVASVYSYDVLMGILLLLNRQSDTNQLINDFVLVHSMFYLLK